jgi:uncharacterized protein (TIGR03067 family)
MRQVRGSLPLTLLGIMAGVAFVVAWCAGQTGMSDKLDDVKIVFEAEKVIVKTAKKDEEASYKIDADKKPKLFDLTLPNGEKMVGIYDLDGDTLKIALSEKGDMRPKDFDGKADPNNHVLVLKRDKTEKK